MAEAAAAFYTVETLAEGAAVGAVAVSRPTVPLVLKFHKIKSPSPALGLSSHSLNYYKGRAYIFGGDQRDGKSGNNMHIITLPSDLSLGHIDYQSIPAEPASQRPLAKYTDSKPSSATENLTPIPRSTHAAASIDFNIFIFGGRAPAAANNSNPTSLIDEQGTVHVFSTIDNRWTTLIPRQIAGSTEVPEPRIFASLTSTPHPAPQDGLEASIQAHGTLLLHGGYTREGKLLRDTWAFDVSSRIWSRWPDLPEPGPEDVAGDGRVYCTESRLWRVGDSFGQVAYLEISRDIADDFSGKSGIGITPKTGKWEVLTFAKLADSRQSGEATEKGPTTRADELPIPRKGAGFLPITSGAGREFFLYFMGEDAPGSTVPDIWTFQIAPETKSPAVLKDKIRAAFGANTGEHSWSRCDVVEATKQDGELERPQGLADFAADAWSDLGGGAVVIWGGKAASGEIMNEGWVLTVE